MRSDPLDSLNAALETLDRSGRRKQKRQGRKKKPVTATHRHPTSISLRRRACLTITLGGAHSANARVGPEAQNQPWIKKSRPPTPRLSSRVFFFVFTFYFIDKQRGDTEKLALLHKGGNSSPTAKAAVRSGWRPREESHITQNTNIYPACRRQCRQEMDGAVDAGPERRLT